VGLIYDFLLQLFPDDGEDARRLRPAIVFIDELDAHLHPTWQRKILGMLRSTFPNIQFIVAAHSPLVVAGCKRGEVTVLRRAAQGVGFQVEQLDRHFLGATTSELYGLLFEIEEKDDTYLHYAAMFPFRAEIQREAKALEARVALPPNEQEEYLGLLDRRNALAHLLTVGQRLLQTTRQERDAPVWREIIREAKLQEVDAMRVTSSMLQERLSLSPDQAARLEALEKRQRLLPEDQKRLDQLREDLYYLAEYERIETIRTTQRDQATQERMDLEDSIFSSTGQET